MVMMIDDDNDDDDDDDGDVTWDKMWEKNIVNISSFIWYTCKKIKVYYTTYIIKKEAM